ncbi:MAG: hypothetical protein AMXMBFR13_45140 [Phycisphaerae bacterium]
MRSPSRYDTRDPSVIADRQINRKGAVAVRNRRVLTPTSEPVHATSVATTSMAITLVPPNGLRLGTHGVARGSM